MTFGSSPEKQPSVSLQLTPWHYAQPHPRIAKVLLDGCGIY